VLLRGGSHLSLRYAASCTVQHFLVFGFSSPDTSCVPNISRLPPLCLPLCIYSSVLAPSSNILDGGRPLDCLVNFFCTCVIGKEYVYLTHFWHAGFAPCFRAFHGLLDIRVWDTHVCICILCWWFVLCELLDGVAWPWLGYLLNSLSESRNNMLDSFVDRLT